MNLIDRDLCLDELLDRIEKIWASSKVIIAQTVSKCWDLLRNNESHGI